MVGLFALKGGDLLPNEIMLTFGSVGEHDLSLKERQLIVLVHLNAFFVIH
jgi:hypothetical protein